MRRRVSAVALAVAAAVPLVPLLGGCGIQETDVIEAGGPASFQAFFDREYEMLLFFRSPDGGLSPVIRSTGSPAGSSAEFFGYELPGSEETPEPVTPDQVVLALLDGPSEEDRAAGLGTALPAARPGGTVEVEPAPGGRVTTRLPFP